MKTKAKLPVALQAATASLLAAQDLVQQPENKEKLIQCELSVRMVMLSECSGKSVSAKGHHGG